MDCSSPFLATVSAIVTKGIALKLIHHDFIYYSSNKLSPDTSREAFSDSISGSALIEERVTGCGDAGGGPCPKDIDASIRSKPGRSLLHCITCITRGHAYIPIYDQRTYRNISCKSPYCDALSNRQCDELGNRGYKIKYSGAPTSGGSLSMESFIFESSDNGLDL